MRITLPHRHHPVAQAIRVTQLLGKNWIARMKRAMTDIQFVMVALEATIQRRLRVEREARGNLSDLRGSA